MGAGSPTTCGPAPTRLSDTGVMSVGVVGPAPGQVTKTKDPDPTEVVRPVSRVETGRTASTEVHPVAPKVKFHTPGKANTKVQMEVEPMMVLCTLFEKAEEDIYAQR